MGEKIALYGATPGLYWSEDTIDTFAAADNRWEKVDFEDDNIEEIGRIAQYISSFGIVTGYNNEDMERCSFMFNIIHSDYKVTKEFSGGDDESIRPSISQMHYLLSYKDKIDAILKQYCEINPNIPVWGSTANEIKKGKKEEFTVWTTKIVGNVVWLMDIIHNSARVDFTNGEYYQLGVINADGYGYDHSNEFYTKNELKENETQRWGVYYTENHPNKDNTRFYPLKEKEDMSFSVTPKYLVFNFDDGSDERVPFFIEIEEKEGMKKGKWDEKEVKRLTKYQWEIFLAHKDLVDMVYAHWNKIGIPNKYGFPDLVWTSTDYVSQKNTLAYYEVNSSKGRGLRWVVYPPLRNSQVIFKKDIDIDYYYPKVGLWE